MHDAQQTAERIKALAKGKNILIKDMLDDCGMNKNVLSTMLSRGSWPQANNLAKIAEYLDCSVDYLLGRTDAPEIQQNRELANEMTSEEFSLLSMFKTLPAEQREDIFDIVFLKYRKYLGQKTDTYSSSANSGEIA